MLASHRIDLRHGSVCVIVTWTIKLNKDADQPRNE